MFFFKLSSEKQNSGLAYIDKQTSCTASKSMLVLVHLHTLIILGCRYRINPEVWHQAINRCSLTEMSILSSLANMDFIRLVNCMVIRAPTSTLLCDNPSTFLQYNLLLTRQSLF